MDDHLASLKIAISNTSNPNTGNFSELRSGETSLQQPLETPSKGSLSGRKQSSHFIKNTLNAHKQKSQGSGQQPMIN